MIRLFSGASIIDRYTKKIDKHVAKLEAALQHVRVKVAEHFERHSAEMDRHEAVKAEINAAIAKLHAVEDRGRKLVQVISTIKNGTSKCS